MTGKRRWSAYLAGVAAMTAVEIVTNQTGLGMSLNYQVGMGTMAAIHFGGIAADKVMKHKHNGNES